MRYFLVLISFFASSFIFAQELINEESLKFQLEYLASDELEGRDTGSEGIEKAAQFIEKHFQKKGLKPFYASYRDSFMAKDMHAYNLIGMVEGTDAKLKNEYVIIGAHYDHVGITKKKVEGDSIVNGANDNATGSVGVLQLAYHFVENPTKRSLLFVLFTAEEIGLLGSKNLAKRMKAEKTPVQSVFNIEMIGVPLGESHAYDAYFTGYDKSNFGELFNSGEDSPILGLYEQAEQMQLFKRSDNWPFYQELNIPAHTVCTFDFTNYDYYHHPKDEAQFMDTEHMTNLLQAFVPGIERIANADKGEVRINKIE